MNRKMIRLAWLIAAAAAVLAGCRSQLEPVQPPPFRVEWLPIPHWAEGAVIYRVPGNWISGLPGKTQSWNWTAHLEDLGVDALLIGPAARISARQVNRFSAILKRSGVRVLAAVAPGVSPAMVDSLDVDGLLLRRADSSLIVIAGEWQAGAQRQRMLFTDSLPHFDVPLPLHGVVDRRFYRELLRVRQSQIRTSKVVEAVLAPADSLVPAGRALLSLRPPGAPGPLRRFGAPALRGYLRFWAALPGFLLIEAGQEYGLDSLRAADFFPGRFTQSGDSALYREYRQLFRLRNSVAALRRGQGAPVQTSMIDGAASSFLRFDDTGVVLVVANLRREPAKMVLLTLSPEQRQLCTGRRFRNFADHTATRLPGDFFFREIAPFTSVIYLSEQTSSKGEL